MDDTQLRVETMLREASKAIHADNNGLYDRADLVELISQFIPVVQELIEASQRERREMTIRLRRSPLRLNETPPLYGDLPSV